MGNLMIGSKYPSSIQLGTVNVTRIMCGEVLCWPEALYAGEIHVITNFLTISQEHNHWLTFKDVKELIAALPEDEDELLVYYNTTDEDYANKSNAYVKWDRSDPKTIILGAQKDATHKKELKCKGTDFDKKYDLIEGFVLKVDTAENEINPEVYLHGDASKTSVFTVTHNIGTIFEVYRMTFEQVASVPVGKGFSICFKDVKDRIYYMDFVRKDDITFIGTDRDAGGTWTWNVNLPTNGRIIYDVPRVLDGKLTIEYVPSEPKTERSESGYDVICEDGCITPYVMPSYEIDNKKFIYDWMKLWGKTNVYRINTYMLNVPVQITFTLQEDNYHVKCTITSLNDYSILYDELIDFYTSDPIRINLAKEAPQDLFFESLYKPSRSMGSVWAFDSDIITWRVTGSVRAQEWYISRMTDIIGFNELPNISTEVVDIDLRLETNPDPSTVLVDTIRADKKNYSIVEALLQEQQRTLKSGATNIHSENSYTYVSQIRHSSFFYNIVNSHRIYYLAAGLINYTTKYL